MTKKNTGLAFHVRVVLAAILCLSVFSQSFKAQANWQFGAAGAAGGFASGFYNPVAFAPGMPGVNPLWGGGYNLNSLSGGGWGGFPAGYGFGPAYPFMGAPSAPAFNGGALTAGFGGFYSPFVGRF